MRTHDLDALVLGRDCHVRAFTGEAKLWLAGTRLFTPAAVVVGATESVYVPPMTWNPAHLIELLRAVPGLSTRDARRRRRHEPGRPRLARVRSRPNATFVDATPDAPRAAPREDAGGDRGAARRGSRRRRRARRDAEHERSGRDRSRAPGRVHRTGGGRRGDDTGVRSHHRRARALDVVLDTAVRLRRSGRVVFRGGVIRAGWEASLARTATGGRELAPAGWDDIVAGCRPGARVGDLPITHGVGRGVEPLAADVVLEPGMVVAVELEDTSALRQDVVLVTPTPAVSPRSSTAPGG